MKKGLGEQQIKDQEKAIQKILNVLDNGERIRYSELQEKTGLSTATLTKHLKKLKNGIVERKVDSESSEYPPPVYYQLRKNVFPKLHPKTPEETCLFMLKYNLPRYDVHLLNSLAGLILLNFLELYSQNPEQNDELFEQTVEHYIIQRYREGIRNLKIKIKELSEKGIEVNAMLADSVNRYKQDYDWMLKKIGKKDRKRKRP